MRIPFNYILVLLFVFLIAHSSIHAQLYSLQTKDLRLIYYTKAHEFVVPHLARCFENSLRFHERLFQYTPSEEVTILLQDFGDYGHGGADIVPMNHIDVGLEPFNYVYEVMPANERMNWLMNHELVHIVACDKASDNDQLYRSLFHGKVSATSEAPLSMLYTYLTAPRRYSPRWYHEGIAVFMETWMAGGLGRVLGGYDEMVFRTMVHDSSTIYDAVGLESEGTTIDFQVGANSYLYGTRFVSYLANMYGPEKLLAWISRTNDSKKYFASQFQYVYGISLGDEWSKWIGWEHDWQHANLDSIRRYPITPYRGITTEALGSVSRGFFDPAGRKLYAAVRYPGRISTISGIDADTGSLRDICEVKGAALYYVSSLAYDPSDQSIFYTTDNNKLRDLNVVDCNTARSRMLIKDARVGDLAFNRSDRSLWGIRHDLGFSTIVRI